MFQWDHIEGDSGPDFDGMGKKREQQLDTKVPPLRSSPPGLRNGPRKSFVALLLREFWPFF